MELGTVRFLYLIQHPSFDWWRIYRWWDNVVSALTLNSLYGTERYQIGFHQKSPQPRGSDSFTGRFLGGITILVVLVEGSLRTCVGLSSWYWPIHIFICMGHFEIDKVCSDPAHPCSSTVKIEKYRDYCHIGRTSSLGGLPIISLGFENLKD